MVQLECDKLLKPFDRNNLILADLFQKINRLHWRLIFFGTNRQGLDSSERFFWGQPRNVRMHQTLQKPHTWPVKWVCRSSNISPTFLISVFKYANFGSNEKDKLWPKIFFPCSFLLKLIRSYVHLSKRCITPSYDSLFAPKMNPIGNTCICL